MKRFLAMLLTLLMALPLLPAMAETTPAKEVLPKEIADLFDVPAWEGYEVPYTTSMPEKLAYIWLEHSDCGLVLQTNGKLNVLCLIERSSKGDLRIVARNYRMILGEYVPIFDSTPFQTPTESTVTLDVYGDDYELQINITGGMWRVIMVRDYNEMIEAGVSTGKITYYDLFEDGSYTLTDMDSAKTAYGTYDNRFAAFNMEDFPKTIDEARAKLTNPPITPTDFYTPVNITLRASEKYDVFSAPGRSSHRPANGKAEMSTNDWVQIFGEENGWLLVQYDISADQMRFGYIDASALPKGTQVQALTWYDLPEQTIKYGVWVTDDPLASNDFILRLEAGAKVKVLSTFDTWYYIETQDASGKTLRGFVTQGCIDLVGWDEWNDLLG